MSEIRERMKVVDKHGAEVGIVDEVEGDRIKLEQGSDNQHHYVDKQLVAEVAGSMVTAGLPNLPGRVPDFQRMLSPAKTSAAAPSTPARAPRCAGTTRSPRATPGAT